MKSFFPRAVFFGHALSQDAVFNAAWLIFRFYLGWSLAIEAGLPKISEGGAPAWFVQQVAGLHFNFPSPQFWATLAAWGEFLGGLCIAFGLLTRIMAAQLAFQFLVIAFLWYDKPAPITGMYYQQLLFWCFVLVMCGGGGRFSLDSLVVRLRPGRKMLRPAAAVLLCFATVLPASAQGGPAAPFATYAGRWDGVLQYLDYQTNDTVSIAARLSIEPLPGDPFTALLRYAYPNEPGHDEVDTLHYDGPPAPDPASGLSWRTAAPGHDGRKPAILLRGYQFGSSELRIWKEVEWEGQPGFFLRSQYLFRRERL